MTKRFSQIVFPIFLVLLLIGATAGFSYRDSVGIRGQGIIRPVEVVELRVPTDLDQDRVEEVFKTTGEEVQVGDIILRLDSNRERSEIGKIKLELTRLTLESEQAKQRMKEMEIEREIAEAIVKEAEAALAGAKEKWVSLRTYRKNLEEDDGRRLIGKARAEVKYREAAVTEAEKIKVELQSLADQDLLSKQKFRKAELDLEKARRKLLQSRESFSLLKERSIQAEINKARTEEAEAKSRVAGAEAVLDQRRMEVERLQAAAKKNAFEKQLELRRKEALIQIKELEADIEKKTLRAPIPGTLTLFQIYPGQWVLNRDPLGQITNLSEFIFWMRLSPENAVSAVPGASVQIRLSSTGQTINGTILENSLWLPGSRTPIDGKAKSLLGLKGPAELDAWVPVKCNLPKGVELQVGLTGVGELSKK